MVPGSTRPNPTRPGPARPVCFNTSGARAIHGPRNGPAQRGFTQPSRCADWAGLSRVGLGCAGLGSVGWGTMHQGSTSRKVQKLDWIGQGWAAARSCADARCCAYSCCCLLLLGCCPLRRGLRSGCRGGFGDIESLDEISKPPRPRRRRVSQMEKNKVLKNKS